MDDQNQETPVYQADSILIQCKERNCKQLFYFTRGEQDYYARHGIPHPKRCPKCRKQFKENRPVRGVDPHTKNRNLPRLSARGCRDSPTIGQLKDSATNLLAIPSVTKC